MGSRGLTLMISPQYTFIKMSAMYIIIYLVKSFFNFNDTFQFDKIDFIWIIDKFFIL